MVLDRSKIDWGREIHRLTKGRGVGVVVDNVGKSTLNTGIKAVSRGGRIVIIGNTSGPHAESEKSY